MSTKILVLISFMLFFFFGLVGTTHAITDPLANPNNKVGVHILFTTELAEVSKLINSSGGDWGYVTIPIQSTDHNLRKWQQFMLNCKKYHIIPILRLATTSDSNNSAAWKKPQLTDIIEFATFLDQLPWPTQNKYVIIFNEVNRGDEWGGSASASEYANILSFAVTVFKSKSPDFFIISSGFDNAAPNSGTTYINEYEYMQQMNAAVPAIFYQVDGLASHSYPNPGFAQPPNAQNRMGVASFKYERDFVKELTGKSLPIFITETGWSSEKVTDKQQVTYYQDTFSTIWNDPGIVAITPFLFEARTEPFFQFSFLTASRSATAQYQTVYSMAKIKGTPSMPIKVLAAEVNKNKIEQITDKEQEKTGFSFSNMIQNIFTSLRGNKMTKE